MPKSKLFIASLTLAGLILSGFIFAPAAYAQANDILSILDRNSKNELTKPPKTIPYVFTVEIDVSGKRGKPESDEAESGEPESDENVKGIKVTNSDEAEIKLDAENYKAVIEINPALTGDERITILSHTGDPEDKAFQEMLLEYTGENVTMEDLASNFWCESDDFGEGEGFPTEALTVISETETDAVVKPDLSKMAKLFLETNNGEAPSKGEEKMIRRMLKRLDGEMRFSKPDGHMKEMKVWMTRSMRVMLIAKIRAMDFQISCEVAPNGFSYNAAQNMDMKMSAFGVKVNQNIHRKVTNLRPLP